MAKKAAAPDREWRISVIGAKAKYVGRVWASDKATAIAKAAEEFKIDPARRFRLVAESVE
jgi:hypothetical protein